MADPAGQKEEGGQVYGEPCHPGLVNSSGHRLWHYTHAFPGFSQPTLRDQH